MRKPAFGICVNKGAADKGANQLPSNCAADERLCFCYIDSTIPLLPKSEILSLKPSYLVVQLGLCWNWSETPNNNTAHMFCDFGLTEK